MTKPEIRRFPVTLREIEVTEIRDLSPRMRRVVFGGPQLLPFEADGRQHPAFESLGPDDHVKLFFPDPTTGRLSLPQQGDGRLHWPEDPPAISREYTPRGYRPGSGRLDLDFVLHGHGVAGAWAEQAKIGDRLHIGGPRGSMLMPVAAEYLLMGDETALPAIANWLEMMPDAARGFVHVLIDAPEARIDLEAPDGVAVQWHHRDPADSHVLARLAADAAPGKDSFVWAGAERAAITALRAELDGQGFDPGQCKLSNYWTCGATADD